MNRAKYGGIRPAPAIRVRKESVPQGARIVGVARGTPSEEGATGAGPRGVPREPEANDGVGVRGDHDRAGQNRRQRRVRPDLRRIRGHESERSGGFGNAPQESRNECRLVSNAEALHERGNFRFFHILRFDHESGLEGDAPQESARHQDQVQCTAGPAHPGFNEFAVKTAGRMSIERTRVRIAHPLVKTRGHDPRAGSVQNAGAGSFPSNQRREDGAASRIGLGKPCEYRNRGRERRA